VGASVIQPVFSRCESSADSHVRAPTRQIQINDPDLGGALQFWRRQTRQHALCRSNSLRFGAPDPNPLLFDWVPCRRVMQGDCTNWSALYSSDGSA
jgi:hypothetical protein